jgi:hypothetical protein
LQWCCTFWLIADLCEKARFQERKMSVGRLNVYHLFSTNWSLGGIIPKAEQTTAGLTGDAMERLYWGKSTWKYDSEFSSNSMHLTLCIVRTVLTGWGHWNAFQQKSLSVCEDFMNKRII